MNKVQKCSKELHKAMAASGVITAPPSCTVDRFTKRGPVDSVKRLVLCRLLDRHDWDRHDVTRFCKRCDAQEWMMGKRWPKIGEPKYYWKRLRLPHIRLRKAQNAQSHDPSGTKRNEGSRPTFCWARSENT